MLIVGRACNLALQHRYKLWGVKTLFEQVLIKVKNKQPRVYFYDSLPTTSNFRKHFHFLALSWGLHSSLTHIHAVLLMQDSHWHGRITSVLVSCLQHGFLSQVTMTQKRTLTIFTQTYAASTWIPTDGRLTADGQHLLDGQTVQWHGSMAICCYGILVFPCGVTCWCCRLG